MRQAYRELANEGWLDLRHGSGATVVSRLRSQATPQRAAEFRNRLRSLIAQMRAEGVRPASIASELRAVLEEIR
jgi:DNA-binding GntR family transcriptional regulator